jgi:hypothetical protein
VKKSVKADDKKMELDLGKGAFRKFQNKAASYKCLEKKTKVKRGGGIEDTRRC